MTETLLASVVLDRAADQIAKTGLAKNRWFADAGVFLQPEDRCYCTFGAARFAAGSYGNRFDPWRATWADNTLSGYVGDLIGGDLLAVMAWSDAPTTTAEMVVDVLRHAASVARLDEQAA